MNTTSNPGGTPRDTRAVLAGFVAATLIGATIAVLGAQWRWGDAMKSPHGQLQLAQQALLRPLRRLLHQPLQPLRNSLPVFWAVTG